MLNSDHPPMTPQQQQQAMPPANPHHPPQGFNDHTQLSHDPHPEPPQPHEYIATTSHQYLQGENPPTHQIDPQQLEQMHLGEQPSQSQHPHHSHHEQLQQPHEITSQEQQQFAEHHEQQQHHLQLLQEQKLEHQRQFELEQQLLLQQQQQQQELEHHQREQEQQQTQPATQDQPPRAYTDLRVQTASTDATATHSLSVQGHPSPLPTLSSSSHGASSPMSRIPGVNGLMERMSSSGSSRRNTNSGLGPTFSGKNMTNLGAGTEDSFSNNAEDYDIRTAIGYGSSAIVYDAYYKPLNKRVAIKVIDLDMFERNQIDELRRETQVMALCKHPNVLRVNGAFVGDSKLNIVTPFLSAGSCLDIMKLAYPHGMDEISIATILKQALQGLDYLHKNGHIHRDVKAGNLLVDDDGSVLLADFGVSSSLMETGDRGGTRKTFVGTPCWMAPEVMEQAGYDYKADIWSFGITAIELATGHAPFAKYPPLKVLMLTLQNDPPTLDRESTKHRYSKSLKDLIDCCLQKDPSRRPSAEKLLGHSFFKQAKKRSYLVAGILNGLTPIEQRPAKRSQAKMDIPDRNITWDFDGDDSSPATPSSAEEGPRDASLDRHRAVTFDTSPGIDVSDLNAHTGPSHEAAHASPMVTPLMGQAVNKPVKKSRFVVEDSSTSTTTTSSPSGTSTGHPGHDLAHSPLAAHSPASSALPGTSISGSTHPDQPLQGLGMSPSHAESGQPVEVKRGRFSVMDTSLGSSSPTFVGTKTMPSEDHHAVGLHAEGTLNGDRSGHPFENAPSAGVH